MVHIASRIFVTVIIGRKPQPVCRGGINVNAPQILIPGRGRDLAVKGGKPLGPLFKIRPDRPIRCNPKVGQTHLHLRLDRGSIARNGRHRVNDQPAIGGKGAAKTRPFGACSLKTGKGCIAELIQQINAHGGLIGGAGLFHGAGQANAQLISHPPLDPAARGKTVDIACRGGKFILHHQHDLRIAQGPVGHNAPGGRALQRLRQGHDPLDIIDLIIPPGRQSPGLQDTARVGVADLHRDGFSRGGNVLFIQKIHRSTGAPERIALRQHVGLGGV